MLNNTKLLYILTTVPSGQKRGGWSGLCTYLTDAIVTLYPNAEVIVCPEKEVSKWDVLCHYSKKIIDGYGLVVTRDINYCNRIASYLENIIKTNEAEILCFGTQLVAKLNKKNQITILTDAFAENLGKAFTNISVAEVGRLHNIDKQALSNSKKLIVLSNIVKNTAIDVYAYNRDNILILDPFVYFDNIPVITYSGVEKPKCKMLFMSMDWKRRNGMFAVYVLNELLSSYNNLELHICGQRPPVDVLNIRNVYYHDIDKNEVSGQQKLFDLYRSVDLLISPAIYDLGSAAVFEAGLFGVPTVARMGGGINENIVHNVNGILIPADSHVGEWVCVIKRLYEDIDYFNGLRFGAYNHSKSFTNIYDRGKKVLEFMKLRNIG